MIHKFANKSIFTILFCFLLNFSIISQVQNENNEKTTDSLSLSSVIREVIQSHPSIKEMEEAINDADTRISLARTGYYPDIDATANYTRLGPTSSITLPQLGVFNLYPANNYSASLNFNENIFDFGKTSRNIDYEKENKVLAKQNVELIKQRLAMSSANCFFTLVYLQDAIVIKNEQLQDLQQHLDFIEKKIETGSGIQYEALSTRVRISSVESQKIDLEASLKIQQSVLNSLLGQPANTSNYIKGDLSPELIDVTNDSLLSYAVDHRDEMTIAKEKTRLAELHYDVLKTKNYPDINIFASAGWKNGYIPNLNTLTANYVVGIGFTLPIFDASRNKNNLLIAKSSILENNYELEVNHRKIINEVVESEEKLKAASKKVDEYNLQLSQAQQAYSLAQVNYREGAITNLDLLDAVTNVSETRLLLLKAQIDYSLNVYSLKQAIGERLY
ncbi:MAG: TolC family protein [Ignavibacteria bacterium]